MLDSEIHEPARLLCLWDSPGKNTGVDCHFLLQVALLMVLQVARLPPFDPFSWVPSYFWYPLIPRKTSHLDQEFVCLFVCFFNVNDMWEESTVYRSNPTLDSKESPVSSNCCSDNWHPHLFRSPVKNEDDGPVRKALNAWGRCAWHTVITVIASANCCFSVGQVLCQASHLLSPLILRSRLSQSKCPFNSLLSYHTSHPLTENACSSQSSSRLCLKS